MLDVCVQSEHTPEQNENVFNTHKNDPNMEKNLWKIFAFETIY